MKVFEIGDQTGIESLTPSVRDEPSPGFGEAVLRVRAVCLNHRDLNVVAGTYGPRRPSERVPVSDGVGEVIAVGAGATNVSIGDRVTCAHFVSWLGGAFTPAAFGADLGITRDGWLAEQVLVPAAALVKVPATMSDEQAVALPAAGLTAWNAVVEVGKVKAGDIVLTLGTGGVSIFALQIAKLNGARVAITSSSDEKLALAKALGADIMINYRTTPDWPAALMEATGGAGADIVVETGGQATLSQSIAAAAVNGRIIIIGALAGTSSEGLPNYGTIIGKNLTLRGIAEGSREMLVNFIRAADVGKLNPVIGKTFRFSEAASAYACLKEGSNVGKVMIRMD